MPSRSLEVDDVTHALRWRRGARRASRFDIDAGEIFGLIGPNGAGKTTCFNVITGVYQPTDGRGPLRGQPLGGRKRHQITQLGIARTFQNIRLFPEMTALENVLVGADAHHRTSVLGALFRLAAAPARGDGEGHERAHASCCEFVGIADRADELARNLPYGYQRRLEIARALATEPAAALPRRAGRRLQPGGEGASSWT